MSAVCRSGTGEFEDHPLGRSDLVDENAEAMRSLADFSRGVPLVGSVSEDHSAAGRDELAVVHAGQFLPARTEPNLRAGISVDLVLDGNGED